MPPTAPPLDPPDVDDAGRPPRSAGRTVALVAGGTFVVASFALWIYALFLYDPGLKVDELADRTFPTRAEQVCARYEARIDALPPAPTAETADERAEVIDRANVILADMVDEVETLVPAGQGRVTEGIREWLDDWRTHIADRQAFADALRTDEDARFLETMRGNRQLSRAIDGFAEVNRMESCTAPGDVG